MKILAPCLITSWQIDGETMVTERYFILGASKSLQMVTAAMKLKDAYSLEGRKVDSILKSRDITLPTKVRLVKAMFFPVDMYGCWTIMKTERRRTDAFEL